MALANAEPAVRSLIRPAEAVAWRRFLFSPKTSRLKGLSGTLSQPE